MVRVPDLSGNGAALFCKFVKLTWTALGNQSVCNAHTHKHAHAHAHTNTYKHTHTHTHTNTRIHTLKENC